MSDFSAYGPSVLILCFLLFFLSGFLFRYVFFGRLYWNLVCVQTVHRAVFVVKHECLELKYEVSSWLLPRHGLPAGMR